VTAHRRSQHRRLALRYATLALVSLAGGILAGAASHRLGVLFLLAGFAGYLFHGKRATALLLGRSGRLAPTPFPKPARRSPPRLIAASVLGLALAPTAHAQQTIFNVPSADVLDPGKVYLEVDELFRPTEPSFSSTTVRGVFGVLPRVEAGVNFGGLVSPGPAVPTASVAVKAQPVRAGEFVVTAGAFGLFYLRGSQDGNPAGLGYGHVSYRLPNLGTRIAVGGWYSSAGYAKPGSTGGSLVTFEQPLPWVKGLTLAADWWSGENAIGYVSPGFYYTTGHWTIYAAYTVKNGDSKGNGGLVEAGFTF
jgi:hypothetical protein